MGHNDNDNQKPRGWRSWFFGERSATPTGEKATPIEALETGSVLLDVTSIGKRLCIVKLNGEDGMIRRLIGMGLIPGIELQVMSTTGDSVVVALNDNRIGLSAGMAKAIIVNEPLSEKFSTSSQEAKMNTKAHLRDLSVGSRGRVVGYEKAARSYKGKLLAMGLTPGTEFKVTRHAPLGDPIEIQVRGFNLSLRKEEANALYVEALKND